MTRSHLLLGSLNEAHALLNAKRLIGGVDWATPVIPNDCGTPGETITLLGVASKVAEDAPGDDPSVSISFSDFLVGWRKIPPPTFLPLTSLVSQITFLALGCDGCLVEGVGLG